MSSRSSNLKICPVLKTIQKVFYCSSPKEKTLPPHCQTKKRKYHLIPHLPFPLIKLSVLLPKYLQVICSSPLPVGTPIHHHL